MNTAMKLKKKIESCELPHPHFADLNRALQLRISDACDGAESRIEWVVGPSRAGKSMMIRTLARANPEIKVDGKRRVPVLVVPIPPNISPVLMPASVLMALQVPIPRLGLTSGVMFNRMVDQLRLAQTRVIIFEEASHLVEAGARVPPRAAGDWFKSAADNLNLTLILVGVPRLQKLFESNEQFRLRASAKRELRPYDIRDFSQKMAFGACVGTYADMFEQDGWPIDLSLDDLVDQLYLLSGGLVGVVSRFMQELASQLRGRAQGPVTFEDCRMAAATIESAGHLDYPAFTTQNVSSTALASAHGCVMESNLMSLPQTIEGGQ